MAKRFSLFLRITTAFLILFSIGVMYYTKIVLLDYEVIVNVDGPDLDE